MSKIKTCLYLIEFKDGRNDTMNKEMIEASVDDIFNDISKIIKRYRLYDNTKQAYYMTLFSQDHNISANDYIEHYSNLPKDKYGAYLLDKFDIEIIRMFN